MTGYIVKQTTYCHSTLLCLPL